MKKISLYITLLLLTALIGCASLQTNTEFYNPILFDLKRGNYDLAAQKIQDAELREEYAHKDRVLLHLDKGIILHYQGSYEASNRELELAEIAIEELYTKSISQGAASMLLNDNALSYGGEVYEDLYINIFKALNYLHLNDFDGAYVEANRVNNKLKSLKIKYEEMVTELNASEENPTEVEAQEFEYLNNVFSHYISHLIYRAEGEYDNSRISLEKLNEAWDNYPDVYNYDKPFAIDSTSSEKSTYLNVLAFAGGAPVKEAIGARITTFEDFITISDPTDYHVTPIPFPGVEYGYNFKFEFPEIVEEGTEVYAIEVMIDSVNYGELQLLENMANVARKSFETNKSITYFKTIIRAVLKGIGASAIGRNLGNEAGGGFLGDIIQAAANAAVDATENADLRCWKTLPGYCFTAEYELDEGTYDITINFLNEFGSVVHKRNLPNYKVKKGLNLVEAFHLN